MSQTGYTTERGAAAIQHAFENRKKNGGKALITYLMAGDPDLGTTEKIVRSIAGIGVDLIELGMPFSDPLADGPVIQRAAVRSLKQNMTMKKLLASIRELRLDLLTPIVIMTYYNLFYRYGLEAFARDAADAGVDGVIIPDLPVEEAAEFGEILDRHGLAMIYLVAPTSPNDRIEAIAKQARGFIYYVSRTGVTGEQKDIAADIKQNIERIRTYSNLPVAVGFGVSTPEQASTIASYADGVVMGSAIVRLIEETKEMQERAATRFLKPIIDALHRTSLE